MISVLRSKRSRCVTFARRIPLPGELRAFWRRPIKKHEGRWTPVAEHDEALHRTLVSHAGNQAMLRNFDDLTDRIRIRIIRRLDFASKDRITLAYEKHAAILEAVEARDAFRAERLTCHDIETARIEIRRITIRNLAQARAAAARDNEFPMAKGVSR